MNRSILAALTASPDPPHGLRHPMQTQLRLFLDWGITFERRYQLRKWGFIFGFGGVRWRRPAVQGRLYPAGSCGGTSILKKPRTGDHCRAAEVLLQ